MLSHCFSANKTTIHHSVGGQRFSAIIKASVTLSLSVIIPDITKTSELNGYSGTSIQRCTKGLVKLHRYVSEYRYKGRPQYNDLGEKRSQLSLYLGMGDKYFFTYKYCTYIQYLYVYTVFVRIYIHTYCMTFIFMYMLWFNFIFGLNFIFLCFWVW